MRELSEEVQKMLFVPQTEKNRIAIDTFLEGLGQYERSIIGKSICSREIWAHKIGNGRGRVAFFATHHALEDIGSCVLYALIYILLDKERKKLFGVDRGLLLSSYSYYIVPVVNPDGVELRYNSACHPLLKDRLMRMSGADFSRWQANGRGVDLNHNYDYAFSEYKRIEADRMILPGPTLYSGEYPESEPESRAVASFVRGLAPMAVVSLHSQGEEIYYSPQTAPQAGVAQRLAQLTGYKVARTEGTACYGGLCDYTGALGIPSFTLELGKGENPLPLSSAYSVFRRVAESLILLPTLL